MIDTGVIMCYLCLSLLASFIFVPVVEENCKNQFNESKIHQLSWEELQSKTKFILVKDYYLSNAQKNEIVQYFKINTVK